MTARDLAEQVIGRIDGVLAQLPQAVKQAHERIIGEDGIHGGPDAVIEIRSPGDETYEKLEFYARLGVRDGQLYLLAEINLERIVAHAEKLRPKALVVDSVQTIFSSKISSRFSGAMPQPVSHTDSFTYAPSFRPG